MTYRKPGRFLVLACLGALGWLSAGLSAAQTTPVATTRIEISRADCQRLVRHQPQADVAYQAGQDVYGRPVAPADLDGGFRVDLPERFTFDLKFQPLDDDEELDQTTFTVGRVSVDVASGQATYNGRPLQSQAQAELSARCQRVLRP